MNLLNIQTKQWEDKLLNICSCGVGSELKEKLGEPEIDGLKILGNVHEYFVKKYGFNKGKFTLILVCVVRPILSNLYIY